MTLRQALDICTELYGEDNAKTCLAVHRLGSALHEKGEVAQAAALFRREIEQRSKPSTIEDVKWMLDATTMLGNSLGGDEQYLEAAKTFQRGVEIHTKLHLEDGTESTLR